MSRARTGSRLRAVLPFVVVGALVMPLAGVAPALADTDSGAAVSDDATVAASPDSGPVPEVAPPASAVAVEEGDTTSVSAIVLADGVAQVVTQDVDGAQVDQVLDELNAQPGC